MTLACAYRHEIDSDCPVLLETLVDGDVATTEFSIAAAQGCDDSSHQVRLVSFVSQRVERRVGRPLCRHDRGGLRRRHRRARGAATAVGSTRFWAASDVVIDGDRQAQQAVRWNLFQLAQATALAGAWGVAAKGVTSGGYDGHYFWDTDVYVVPYLAYTNPDAARGLLLFRSHMLDSARARAVDLSQRGALFPWRTISGEEASAYYPAGTAQYHINAAVVYALSAYVQATGDLVLLADEGAEILVETARFWEDLGFYRNVGAGGAQVFHIHGVTGPDEYTAVVNDNAYTNLMAQFSLRYAAHTSIGSPSTMPTLTADSRPRPAWPTAKRQPGTGPPTRCSFPTTSSSGSTRKMPPSSRSSRGTSREPQTSRIRCCCTTTRS